MAERPVTAYLGPERGRWTPTRWSDVVDAAAGGLLDESHWIDLKRELPPRNRAHNTELAQDLASLAVDGGVLVIGIETMTAAPAGYLESYWPDLLIVLTKLLATVRPSLAVRSQVIPDFDREGWGCLLVHVPPSPRAPHMVDYVYYGRSDRANMRLADEQVRTIIDAASPPTRLAALTVAADWRGP